MNPGGVHCCLINVREYRRGNNKLTIQRNWQQDEDKQNKNTTNHFTEENTNNVNKT